MSKTKPSKSGPTAAPSRRPSSRLVQSFDRQIRLTIQDSIEVKAALLERGPVIAQMAAALVDSFKAGGKLILFGNGGSAADAQHVAAEFVNRFLIDRDGLPAIALTTDPSVLTSVANDRGFDQAFARQVGALVREKDVVIGISTSGNSTNVLNGVAVARARGAITLGLAGRGGGKLKDQVDICLCVPSDLTPRIQEAHITVLHAICEVVERELFS